MSERMTYREGQLIGAVSLVSLLVACAVASGAAMVARGAGLPWWIVTPAAWIVVYLTMRTLLRYFFTLHFRSN